MIQPAPSFPTPPIRHRRGALTLSVALLLVALYLASPLYALSQLRAACETHDRDRLETLVDFPAVRTDLKAQVSAMVLTQLGQDQILKCNPFAALGAVLAPAIIDQLIDAYVTPDGITALLLTGKAPSPAAPGPQIQLPAS